MTFPGDEYIEIDGFVLSTHAYWVESLAPLFNITRAGATEQAPYVAGGISYRKRRTSQRVSLTVHVIGEVDASGNPEPDARLALYEHLATIEDELLTDTVSTRTLLWHRPDGDRNAQVDVMSWTVSGDTPVSAVGQLEIEIPNGWFDPTGS